MNDRLTGTQGSSGTSAVRVGLTLGGIVLAAVVIFSLGVMEGSRVVESIPMTAEPPSAPAIEPVRTPPPAPVASATAGSPDKLTFYDRLSGVAPPPPLTLPEAQPPAHGPAAATPPAQETPARQPEAQTPQTTAMPASTKIAAVAPPPAPATLPLPAASPAAEPVAKTAGQPKADAIAQIRKLAGKGRFTVQMAAVSERSAAAETAARIKRTGFEPVTVMATVKGKTWYRIRVGSFPNKQAAAQAAGIFHSAFGLNAIPVEN